MTEDNFGYTATVMAIFSGKAGAVNVLLNKGQVPIDSVGVLGNTPLIWATYFNNLEIVKQLVGMGADVSVNNKNGENALTVAYNRWGNLAPITLFLSQQAY